MAILSPQYKGGEIYSEFANMVGLADACIIVKNWIKQNTFPACVNCSCINLILKRTFKISIQFDSRFKGRY